MKVLHVITTLAQGGAEAVLYRLASVSRPDLEHVIVSLMGEAYYGSRLRSRGLEVHTLDTPRRRVTVKTVPTLRRLVRAVRPDVVQTWMYHADLLGGLAARWAGVRSVVWGIRHSNVDTARSNFSSWATARTCARLSRWLPARIACCSVRAARMHQALGYRAEKFVVIQNGCDLTRFFPDEEARSRVRARWGIPPDSTLLGMVARWDPHKDHPTLLRALAHIARRGNPVHCALVGTGMAPDNTALTKVIRELGLRDRTILAGPRDDIPAVMNALDLHVLSSSSEAFPNVVTEAMASATPCVVTDVGDAALIVGHTGWVVSPRDAEGLARAIEQALTAVTTKGRAQMGQACRTRVEQNFSLDRMVGAYQALWSQLVEPTCPRADDLLATKE